jgi:hypothetical protein
MDSGPPGPCIFSAMMNLTHRLISVPNIRLNHQLTATTSFLGAQDNAESLNHLMTFILVFMGSPSRMRNPHFRANMAEALEALMPPKQDDRNTYFNMRSEMGHHDRCSH